MLSLYEKKTAARNLAQTSQFMKKEQLCKCDLKRTSVHCEVLWVFLNFCLVLNGVNYNVTYDKTIHST